MVFADTVHDALYEIDADLNRAYPKIYPKRDVINMLAALRLMVLLSNAQDSQGKLIYSKSELKEMAKNDAEEAYVKAYPRNPSDLVKSKTVKRTRKTLGNSAPRKKSQSVQRKRQVKKARK